MTPFQAFLVMVLTESALRDELLAARDLPTLVQLTRERARERGIELREEELRALIVAHQRSWIQRWVDA